MVHRDLKLKNLFLTKRSDGRPLIKVIDFGVVKLLPRGDEDTTLDGSTSQLARQKAREMTLTGSAMLVGSVHYMAPEQIVASNIVDARADVWSLGVCLYTMLTATLPFEGETVAAVCAAIQGRPPRDVRELAPSVPPGLAAAVTRALEKDVRRRFANVAELAAAIAPYGADPEAPARIEAILRSNVRANAPSVASSADADEASTVSMDAGPPGRVESTIDAAAVGSLSTRLEPQANVGTRRALAAGLVLALGAGAAAIAVVWTRPEQRAGPAPEPSISSPVVAATSPAPVSSDEAPPPALGVSSVVSSLLSVATMSPAPAPRPVVKRRPPKPVATPRQPATAPKPEPSSAYDHF